MTIPKSVMTINQARKNSSKSKTKKTTPRSPPQPNRILRSYNSITNQVQAGAPLTFSKSRVNRTLNSKLGKKSLQTTLNGINSSMNDITNRSVANCLSGKQYFLPLNSKS